MSDEDTPKVSDLSLSTESAAVLPKTEDGSQIAEEATGTNGTKAAEEKEVVTDDAPVDGMVTIHLFPFSFEFYSNADFNCFASSYRTRPFK